MSEPTAIGLDAGGTKIAGLVVEAGGAVLARTVVDTPAEDAEAAVRTMVGVSRALLAEHPEAPAVGVGAAGMVSLEGVIRFAPNIAWSEFPLADRLSRAIGLPVLVENDGNAAAWGEFRFGAGRGWNDMLAVTVGTGIGGGIVAGGRLFRGEHGFAAEIGHIVVDPGGPRCGCGNLGCWEQVASGRAIGRLGVQAGRDHPESLIVELAGGDPEKVTGPIVTDAAMKGDLPAVHVLAEVGRRLGEGIAGLVNVLDPGVVVVGGGGVEAGDLLLDPARRAFADTVEAPEHRPSVAILAAELGNDAGAIGAADLALTELAR